jgi:hypothetical protein
MPAWRDHWWLLGVLFLMLAGAACTSVPNQPRSDSQSRVVLIVHRGDADVAQVRADARDVVSGAAQEGARIAVYALDSGSAASMSQIVLSDEANGGNFVLTGGNQRYRDREALRYADLVMSDLDPVFQPTKPSKTGADLIGAVAFGVAAVDRLPGDGPAAVSLVTGGGVHRTVDLDLVAVGVTPENAIQISRQSPPLDKPTDIVVELRGVGRFEGATPPVEPQFAHGVRAFWEALCPQCVLR